MSVLQKLEVWANKPPQTQNYPLQTLTGAVIGVDASYYLDLRLNGTTEEPLKHALGGIPFCLKKDIEDDLQAFKEAGVDLIFVFNGLDFVNRMPSNSRSADNMKIQEDGWRHYMSGDPTSVLSNFSKAAYPAEIMYRFLQKVLHDNDIQFLVAPYSATAQLAYLVKLPEQFIDAVMGSLECFLFNVDKVITNFSVTDGTFQWVNKASCEERLKIPGDLFRDAQLLMGTSYCPTFPILERMAASTKQPVGIPDAISLLNNAGRSVIQLCNYHRDDPQVQSLQYPDRYKKAIMTVRHHVILETNGAVAPIDFDRAPGDVHEFVGQRLPEELFFYISKGILGSQVPNWLTSGEIELSLPGGVMDSEPYRRLVIEQLNPIRTEALKMLAETLNYYYQSRIIKIKAWDGRDTQNLTIALKESPPLRTKALQWKVRGDQIQAAFGKSDHRPTFLSCLQALKDESYAQSSINKAKLEHPALRTKDEIIANTSWRFLQVRGYVDDRHKLTKWGLVLETVLTSFDTGTISEDYGILAVELLRLGLLNGNMISGTAIPMTDKQHDRKVYTNLISKIACLGRIRHKSTGYVGPLDRQLLTFAWMVTLVRTSLRDLVETVLVSMFLNGEADRDRQDWAELAQRLPFVNDSGSALGVATKTYLDALNDEPEITDELKVQVKSQEDKFGWFSQVKGGTLNKSLDLAWKIWDATRAGVEAGKDPKDIKLFTDANEWLASRR